MLNLKMGVTAEPPHRVMGGTEERGLTQLLCLEPQPACAAQAVLTWGCSSKALPASFYGHNESRPGEEQGRSPSPRLPSSKGPHRDYSALPLT